MGSFLLKSRFVVLPDKVASGAIHVDGEKIVAFIPERNSLPDLPVEDFGNLWLMPGVVDSHVHINEPGRTEWEGFETATASAAAGGITTLVDMPLNSDPVTTTAQSLQDKIAASHGKLAVDCGFYAGLIPGNTGDLPALLDGGVLGVKAFLTYSGIPEFPAATQKELYKIMPLLADQRIPLLVHAELESPVIVPEGPNTSYRRYLASRPPDWEVAAIGMIIAACRETGCPVHIVHLACADALPLIESAKAEGLPVTVETCPHYLHFCAEEIPDADTRFKCSPPIRDTYHREALWNALRRGVIDMVASDHSPCPPELKELESGDFFKAWGGICSLQLGISIINTRCREKNIPVENISHWMSTVPAQMTGLYPVKGLIARDADADIIVFDPVKPFKVNASSLHHRHKITPYDNETLVGAVERTYLRGQCVFNSHEQISERRGRVLLRQ